MATQPHNEVVAEIPPSLLQSRPPRAAAAKPKKQLVRRTDRDYSQALRRSYQFAFLVLNVYLGGMFYLWVRHFDTGIGTKVVARPAGVEGWLPIAGLMNLKYWLVTGRVPAVHPAAMFLLISFLAISFLFRKAFCSWLCPIGTFSEYLWRAGHWLFRRNFALPRWIDVPMRGLKYLLLGFFVWAVSSMSADAIAAFMRSPYGLIADVKMLNLFRRLSETGLIVLGTLIVASIFVQNFWCRYLCPYGALLGLTSLFSPLRIRRNAGVCIDCSKCAKACSSLLPVDKLVLVKSAECTACMECVAVCPVKGALELSLWTGASRRSTETRQAPALPAWAVAVGIAALFLGIVGYAKTEGIWQTQLPRSVYLELVPQADQASHPMPGDSAPGQ